MRNIYLTAAFFAALIACPAARAQPVFSAPSAAAKPALSGLAIDGGKTVKSAEAAADAPAEITAEGGIIRLYFAALPNAEENGAGTGRQNTPLYGLADIELKPGWKTYWRNPGTSGLSPEISLKDGAKAEILFPAPQIFTEGEERIFGYKGRVLLPFRIYLPPQPQQNYSGSLFIGLCKSMCMPQNIPFRFSAAPPQNAAASARINAALRALPREPRQDFALIRARAEGDGLELLLRYPQASGTGAAAQNSAPSLFLDGGEIQLGAAEPQAAKAASGKLQAERVKTQIYHAKILFGEAKTGTEIAYTAALGSGQSIAGTVKIDAAASPPAGRR